MGRLARAWWVCLLGMGLLLAGFGAGVAAPYWAEEFSGSALDLGAWDEMGKADWGTGRIGVGNGHARFRGQIGARVHYPTIATKTDPFPAAGDWMLEYRMGWTTPVTTHGNGAMASEGLDGTTWGTVRVVQTWRDTSGLRLFGQGGSYHWGAPGTSMDWHTYAVRKVGTEYTYYLDGALEGTEVKFRKPDRFILGNAGGMANGWSDFSVDFVRIFQPGPPVLTWLGSPEYIDDGVKPNGGPPSTQFLFRVRVTDKDNGPLTRQALIIKRQRCDGSWGLHRAIPLTRTAGTLMTGAVYYAATKLPNGIYRYRFDVADAGGAATGAPGAWQDGPRLIGTPFLCWVQKPGYGHDGVSPNKGPAGATYTFKVLYRDGAGDPLARRQLLIRRDGVPWAALNMRGVTGGDRRTGRIYRQEVLIDSPGAYTYRFDFADATGAATGAPSGWRSMGPVTSGGLSTAQLTGLSAVQVKQGGAQVSFTLSADAAVTATVLNVAGREVRELARARDMGAGINSLLWDGRNTDGLAAPGGTYLVRLAASSADGGQAQAVAVVRLRR